MVLTWSTWRQWKMVVDSLCEIVQRILEVETLFLDYETVLVWHAELSRTMEYPTVDTLVRSLYGVPQSVYLEDNLECEVVVNHLSRWWEPFKSFKGIEDSVGQVLYWMQTGMDGFQPME